MAAPMKTCLFCRLQYLGLFGRRGLLRRIIYPFDQRINKMRLSESNNKELPSFSKLQKRMKIRPNSLARMADGSAEVQLGNTSVLVTVVGSKEPSSSDMLPLTVDYREKAAAAGRIPTNFLRRETGPTEKEILTSRLIDRSIRPMFPADYNQDIQVTCNLLAIDGENDPVIASINAASAALYTSNIPWNGPVGAVRVGFRRNGDRKRFDFIETNPCRLQQQNLLFDLVIVASADGKIVMLEGGGDPVPLESMKILIRKGLDEARYYAEYIAESCDKLIKTKRTFSPTYVIPSDLFEAVQTCAEKDVKKILRDPSHDKMSRDNAFKSVRHKMITNLLNENVLNSNIQLAHEAYSQVVKKLFRNQILEDKVRCDGRVLYHVRWIDSSVDLYQPLHGSALFRRGQTQVLCTVTFDSLESSFQTDQISVLTGAVKKKNFMLHYEFPPYATNEIRQVGDKKKRRELGHGALAEKALRPVIPDDFPFCIRLTSEVLESNGSSSMASVCGGSMALMDAGVPIKEPLAGVAVGLVTKREGEQITDYALMLDILGIEDYMGDMDFKIAGSKNGFTALQLDLKIPGAPVGIIQKALDLSLGGLKHILKCMQKAIEKPREEKKPNHPIIETLNVQSSDMPRFLGIGGYNLRKLRAETGITIDTVDQGTYRIFAPNQEAMEEAKAKIATLLESRKVPELEFNAIYQARITELREHGVMVQLHPNMDPVLLHNSQLDHRAVSHPSSLGFEVGQVISVKYFGRDPGSGRVRLSRKVITAPSARSVDFIKDDKDAEKTTL